MIPEKHWGNTDRLPDDELYDCANWEIWREYLHRVGLSMPPSWLQLTTAGAKSDARTTCPVRKFGHHQQAVFEPTPIYASTIDDKSGIRFFGTEIVEIGIIWRASNEDILKGFNLWLQRQRQKNVNAKHFAGKKGGRTYDPLKSGLMPVAMLRANTAGLSREAARIQLMELARRAACTDRFLPKRYSEALKSAESLFDQS